MWWNAGMISAVSQKNCIKLVITPIITRFWLLLCLLKRQTLFQSANTSRSNQLKAIEISLRRSALKITTDFPWLAWVKCSFGFGIYLSMTSQLLFVLLRNCHLQAIYEVALWTRPTPLQASDRVKAVSNLQNLKHSARVITGQISRITKSILSANPCRSRCEWI